MFVKLAVNRYRDLQVAALNVVIKLNEKFGQYTVRKMSTLLVEGILSSNSTRQQIAVKTMIRHAKFDCQVFTTQLRNPQAKGKRM